MADSNLLHHNSVYIAEENFSGLCCKLPTSLWWYKLKTFGFKLPNCYALYLKSLDVSVVVI